MTTYVRLEQRGYGGWKAYLDGHSSALLRPVPGNTEPARAYQWDSLSEAAHEILQLFGAGTRITYLENGLTKVWG